MDKKDQYSSRRIEMVTRQIKPRGDFDPKVLDVINEVPRHLFVPEDLKDKAYQDRPLPIGRGQTISQPYIVAFMTQKLKLDGEEKVLEIGTGSGYQAAILGKLAKEVHTIERHPELAEKAKATLSSLGYENIHVHIGDGTLGYSVEAPYNRIITTAAAPCVPESLLEQLAVGGKLIIPTGSRWRQVLELWERTNTGFDKDEILPVVFVPLIGAEGWQE